MLQHTAATSGLPNVTQRHVSPRLRPHAVQTHATTCAYRAVEEIGSQGGEPRKRRTLAPTQSPIRVPSEMCPARATRDAVTRTRKAHSTAATYTTATRLFDGTNIESIMWVAKARVAWRAGEWHTQRAQHACHYTNNTKCCGHCQ